MPEIILVSGEVNSGKTSLMCGIFREEVSSGTEVAGILALSIMEDGQKTGFEVLDVSTGEKKILASVRRGMAAGEAAAAGKYFFMKEGFNFALKALSRVSGTSVVFIDEAGPLELSGAGYADAIRKIISIDPAKIYISVRSRCLKDFVSVFLAGVPYTVRYTK